MRGQEMENSGEAAVWSEKVMKMGVMMYACVDCCREEEMEKMGLMCG